MFDARTSYATLGGAIIGILSSLIVSDLRAQTVLVPDINQPTLTSQNPVSISANHDDGYRISIFSIDPLVIYVENFVTAREASVLVALAEGNFQPSEIWSNDGASGKVVPTVRDSRWASPSKEEPMIQEIEKRVKAFQGYNNVGFVEPMKVLKYEVGGHYNHHHDSFPQDIAKQSMEGNRLSTFFVYLDANCTGGGTNFPRLTVPEGEDWCTFIDCDESYDSGVTFRPLAGNAIFWYNLRNDSQEPHPDLLHSGLPVTSGTKIGLNIWTWTLLKH